jgi:hypothetical protein
MMMMMMIIIIIIIIIIRGWDKVVFCTHHRGIDASIQPLYAQDRPCMMKSHPTRGSPV